MNETGLPVAWADAISLLGMALLDGEVRGTPDSRSRQKKRRPTPTGGSTQIAGVRHWTGLQLTRTTHTQSMTGRFTTLAIEVPCCGGSTTPDVLDYDRPCGFARFEIAIWNPERLWFGEGELTALADLLGHPVKQIRAHV
ncbi:hypothetical protein [Streptomyces lavendulae]|uniref:hypothetical protein n=1 Tax=Streptomyces lavendulae TaxID=1914 RepID=UPI0024A358DC|nr:hypothetical protein [Streptomyces lavendulae]GLW02412.1 hypothetical protein Slala05_60420 [Streptomyces lavendulae subsp. lavendulae]